MQTANTTCHVAASKEGPTCKVASNNYVVFALQFEKQHVKSNFNLDDGKIEMEYFKGGRTNIAYNCLDKHVKDGRGDQPCFLWEGNETDQSRVLTYKQVLEEVSRLVSHASVVSNLLFKMAVLSSVHCCWGAS